MKLMLFAASLAATVLASPAAFAGCDPFIAHGPHDQREAHHVDVGNDGPSVGDKVVGQRGLTGEDGKPIGTFQWLATVNELDDSGVPMSSDASVIMTLDRGALFGVGTVRHGRQLETYSEGPGIVPRTTASWDIIGGTGDFSGASGMLTLEVEDSHNIFRADLTCN